MLFWTSIDMISDIEIYLIAPNPRIYMIYVCVVVSD